MIEPLCAQGAVIREQDRRNRLERRFPIVTFDGGGVRGVLSLVILDRLERRHPFLDRVALFAGTSTGGLIALGLAAGISPAEISKLYLECARAVFEDTFWDDASDLGRLIGAEYSHQPLKRLLKARFGDSRLADLSRHVLIPTFDLDNDHPSPERRTWKAKFFHNFPGADSDRRETLVDVGLRTTAAPTYFPVYQGFIDGGVVANNPGMCAVAQAIDGSTGGQRLEDLALLSIGTGKNARHLDATASDWGLAHWAPHLVNILFEGQEGVTDYQCQRTLGNRYYRLDPELSKAVGLDEIDRLDELIRLGRGLDLNAALDWLAQNIP